MVDIRRIEVEWSGLTGLPGVSVFYSADGVDPTGNLGTFYEAVKGLIPGDASITIPASGDKLDVETGALTGSWSDGTGATVDCTGAGSYAAGTGAFVRWNTDGIVAGRRVRGRTFLCPLIVTAYESNGTIATAARGTIQTAATALADAVAGISIWARPRASAPNGSAHFVQSALVPDQVTSLRTRRT